MSILNKPRILIIDDDNWQCDIYSDLLKDDYIIMQASNLNQAVDLVDKALPDIIIADILLAGETIFTLLNELQSDVDLGRIPVILISNTANRLGQLSMNEYGVVRVLDKSKITPEDIMAALRFAL